MANNRVHKAENLKPDFFLLDVGLPKLNEIDACRFIRKRAPQARVVFLSQETDVDVVNAALDAGALGYVLKVRARLEMRPAIKPVLQGIQFVGRGLKVPVFDIFCGMADKDAVWVETVNGLSSAPERMETAQ